MDNSIQEAAAPKRSSFDVTDVLNIVWKRKWLIVLPTILVTVITLAGSYLITPEYESSAIIWIGNPVKLSSELQHLLGDVRQSYRSTRDEELELKSLQNEITSSPYISQLVRNLHLDQDPGIEKAAARARTAQPNLPLEQIKLDLLVDNLREKIKVNYAGKDQVQLTVQSTDPFKARDMAQNLSEVFISEKMKQELGSVRVSQDFSYDQLAKYDKDLEDKIDKKTSSEREYNKIKLDDIVASDENRRQISSEIEGTKLDIEEKKSEERNLLAKLSSIPSKSLVPEETPELKRFKADVENHLGSIGNLLVKYTWNAPEVLSYKTRLFTLLGEIEDEHKQIVERQFSSYDKETRTKIAALFNVRSELDVIYARDNQLKLALDDLNRKVDLIPYYQATLDQLDREVTAARDIRDKFRDQQEGSQISQALVSESRYKVIEPAKVPLSPFKPQRGKFVVLGFLLGVVIGGSAALLTEIFDKSFRRIEEVEEALGYRVIGVIPHIKSLRQFKVRK